MYKKLLNLFQHSTFINILHLMSQKLSMVSTKGQFIFKLYQTLLVKSNSAWTDDTVNTGTMSLLHVMFGGNKLGSSYIKLQNVHNFTQKLVIQCTYLEKVLENSFLLELNFTDQHSDQRL